MRRFVPCDLSVLKEKLTSTYVEDGFDPYELPEKILRDFRKVEFDFENYEIDNSPGYGIYQTLTGWQTHSNGLHFLGMQAGGDWEFPIFVIIYWDGKHLRGYVPKDGNVWNTDTKKAYGNDETGADGINLKKRHPDIFDEHEASELSCEDCPNGHPDKILADIGARIQPRE